MVRKITTALFLVALSLLAPVTPATAQRATGDAYLSTRGPGAVAYHGHCKAFSLDIRVDSQKGDHFKATVQTYHRHNGRWVARYDANRTVTIANRWIKWRQLGVICERGPHLVRIHVRAFYDTFDQGFRDRHFVGTDGREVRFRAT